MRVSQDHMYNDFIRLKFSLNSLCNEKLNNEIKKRFLFWNNDIIFNIGKVCFTSHTCNLSQIDIFVHTQTAYTCSYIYTCSYYSYLYLHVKHSLCLPEFQRVPKSGHTSALMTEINETAVRRA